jgi:hypothetical protein
VPTFCTGVDYRNKNTERAQPFTIMRNPFSRRNAAGFAAANDNNDNNDDENDFINPDDNLQDPLESFLGTLGDRAQGLRESVTEAATAARASAAHASAGFDPAHIRRATEASLRGVAGAGGGYTNAGDSGEPAQGPPPASAKALRELPVVTVQPADLIDPVNRECCVCYEGHAVTSKVVRLPCAHIFHPSCIGSWLRQRCTCPVCRYELPTSSPDYERGRVQRMGLRKPRFARHELDRLSIKECKALWQRSRHQPPNGVAATANATHMPIFCDKANLIDFLIQNGAVDLIVAPAPVTSYKLSELNHMSIGQLKRCMNDEAGVFFDPKDVIEKSDMVRIFVNSGRLDVVLDTDTDTDDDNENHPEHNEENEQSNDVNIDDDDDLDRKPAAVGIVHKESSPSLSKGPTVETVSEDSDDEGAPAGDYTVDGIDDRVDTTLVMEENVGFTGAQQAQQNDSSRDGTTDASSDTPISTSDDGNYEDEEEARRKRPRFLSEEEK